MNYQDTRRSSLVELRAMRDRSGTGTAADAPARPVDATFWREARLMAPGCRNVHTGLRIDADMLDWFEAKGADGRSG